MKDYKLSEIKKECSKHTNCMECIFFKIICEESPDIYPAGWEIEEGGENNDGNTI